MIDMGTINTPLLTRTSPDREILTTQVEQANKEIARAYWWMKATDADTAQKYKVNDKIQNALALLQRIEYITMDIVKTIEEKS